MARKGVELFNKATFEEALPKLKATNKPAWRCIGLDKGEYAYLISLGSNKPASVYVRSSVDVTGWSRATGEDSIRAFVVESTPSCSVCYRNNNRVVKCEDRNGQFFCPKCNQVRVANDLHFPSLSGKVNRWTTRLPGWQDRMNEIIRFLAQMAVRIDVCPKCSGHGLVRLNKVKKAGPNKGRWFMACKESDCYFEWMTQRDNDDDQEDDTTPRCPGCDGKTIREFTVKKEGPNKGRKFLKCSDQECNYFQWLDEEG
jgi:hypothetical protein